MKRLMIGMLLFCIFACMLSGCETSAPTDGLRMIVLNGFETQKDLSLLNYRDYLGTVTLNDDARYVKHGERSAKVLVAKDVLHTSTPSTGASPALFQPAEVYATGEEYTDFSKIGTVTLEVYNAQEDLRRIGLQVEYESKKEPVQWYELSPSAWNTLTLNVSREYIPLKTDGEKEIPYVSGIGILFERDKGQDCVYYLDEFKLFETDAQYQREEMRLKEGEICSFDELWQFKNVVAQGSSNLAPTLSWVNNISANGSALRLDSSDAPVPKDTVYFAGVKIPNEICSLADFRERDGVRKYDDNDKLCFDVYTPADKFVNRFNFSVQYGNNTVFASGYLTLEYGWNHFEFTVAQLNSGENITALCRFENATSISFSYRVDDNDPVALIIDEIRMEVVG